MRRLLSVWGMLFLLALGMMAQNKVVERSAKKAPDWLNTAVEGHLVVTVTANSLAEAQTKALSEVTERIILSVASNVSVSQKNVSSESVVNGEVDSRDEFSRVAKLRSANLPFLKGISQTKINGVYWVHYRNKSTGKEYYEYSVKYPYSILEQRRLQSQFEDLDSEKKADYDKLEANINQLTAVEEIKAAITQLASLREFFIDDVRIAQVDGLTKRYKQLYDALTLSGEFIQKGKYRCQLLLNGKPIKVAKLPTVTSNCASQIDVRPSNGAFLISYDDIDCLPEEENFLSIQLRVEGKKLEHKAYLSDAK